MALRMKLLISPGLFVKQWLKFYSGQKNPQQPLPSLLVKPVRKVKELFAEVEINTKEGGGLSVSVGNEYTAVF